MCPFLGAPWHDFLKWLVYAILSDLVFDFDMLCSSRTRLCTTLDLRIGVQPSLVSYGIAMLATNRLGRWEAFWDRALGEALGDLVSGLDDPLIIWAFVWARKPWHSLRSCGASQLILVARCCKCGVNPGSMFDQCFIMASTFWRHPSIRLSMAFFHCLGSWGSGHFPDAGCLHAARLAAKEALHHMC